MFQRDTLQSATQYTIAELHAKCTRLSTSKTFGCLNRNGLDEAIDGLDLTGLSLVYIDVDDLKLNNLKFGKLGVNDRIFAALQSIRSTDLIFGQFFSGDEFAALIETEHAFDFALRLQANFKFVEMSITVCIVEIKPRTSVEYLADQCDRRINEVKQSAKGLIIFL